MSREYHNGTVRRFGVVIWAILSHTMIKSKTFQDTFILFVGQFSEADGVTLKIISAFLPPASVSNQSLYPTLTTSIIFA